MPLPDSRAICEDWETFGLERRAKQVNDMETFLAKRKRSASDAHHRAASARTGGSLMTPIEMQVEEQNEHHYRVRYDAWHYREPRDDGSDKIFLAISRSSWLDIVAFMLARKLVDEGGYDLDRELIVKLQGSDRELAHAPLGIAAATPLLNTKAGDPFDI